MKCVVFRIDNDEYAIDIECVKGIEDKVGVTSVPNRPDYVLGIINLRGDVIPVFSIRRKFSMDEVKSEITKLIVVSIGEDSDESERVAFKVDEVTRIADVDDKDIHELPAICQKGDIQYVKNVASIDGKLIIILDVDNTLSDEEIRELEKTKKDAEN